MYRSLNKRRELWNGLYLCLSDRKDISLCASVFSSLPVQLCSLFFLFACLCIYVILFILVIINHKCHVGSWSSCRSINISVLFVKRKTIRRKMINWPSIRLKSRTQLTPNQPSPPTQPNPTQPSPFFYLWCYRALR